MCSTVNVGTGPQAGADPSGNLPAGGGQDSYTGGFAETLRAMGKGGPITPPRVDTPAGEPSAAGGFQAARQPTRPRTQGFATKGAGQAGTMLTGPSALALGRTTLLGGSM